MFGGKLQSTLYRQGMKETVIVEPFFSLQLDIQVRHVGHHGNNTVIVIFGRHLV